MRLISDGFGSAPVPVGASRSLSPSRMSLQSLTHSLQMHTDGPETSRATSSWPRPQNEQRIGCGVAMRFFMEDRSSNSGIGSAAGRPWAHPSGWGPRGPGAASASFLDDLVHQTVRLGLLGRHPVIAVRVPDDL